MAVGDSAAGSLLIAEYWNTPRAAFACATRIGLVMPTAAVPLRLLAALMAYSRVHTGVHDPGDVVAGSLMGVTLAQLTTHALERNAAQPTGGRDHVDDVGAGQARAAQAPSSPAGITAIPSRRR
jgi:hypothetical protein